MSQRPRLSRQRRQQILEAAVEIIVERGLCDSRLTDVAERAGSSAALVLYYFESKDRLLTEALAFAEDRFYLSTFHELTDLADPRDQLVRLIEVSCPRAKDGGDGLLGDWTLWIELWSRALRDPEAARKRAALDRRWRGTIVDVVRAGQRTGVFGDVDAERFALRLASLIDGLAIQVLLRDADVTSDRMYEACIEMATGELGFDARRRGPTHVTRPPPDPGAPRKEERHA